MEQTPLIRFWFVKWPLYNSYTQFCSGQSSRPQYQRNKQKNNHFIKRATKLKIPLWFITINMSFSNKMLFHARIVQISRPHNIFITYNAVRSVWRQREHREGERAHWQRLPQFLFYSKDVMVCRPLWHVISIHGPIFIKAKFDYLNSNQLWM